MRPAPPPARNLPGPPLVLIGLPAAGKTTIAYLLSQQLHWAVIDTDQMIEQQAGSAIPWIFAHWGEAYFRQLEESAVATSLALSRTIISLGGGAVESAANRSRLAGQLVIWLDVSLAVASRRAATTNHRPLLNGDSLDGDSAGVNSRLAELLERRREWYEAVATYRVDADPDPEQVCATILELIQADLTAESLGEPDQEPGRPPPATEPERDLGLEQPSPDATPGSDPRLNYPFPAAEPGRDPARKMLIFSSFCASAAKSQNPTSCLSSDGSCDYAQDDGIDPLISTSSSGGQL